MGSGITNSILMMLVIMMSINVGLAFTQNAVDDLTKPYNRTTPSILNEQLSPLSSYHDGSLNNGSSLITSDMLPSDDAVTDDTGNIFTDTYTALKSWVSGGVETLGFLANVLVQPAGFMRNIGIPTSICLVVQILWSMIFIILITAWIMGRT